MKLKRAYWFTAANWLNAWILLALLTLALGGIFHLVDRARDARVLRSYNTRAIRSLSATQAADLFEEFWRQVGSSVNRPWVGFSELPWHSQRVNVDASDPLPIRRTPAPSGISSSAKVVWLFGGSTAFGYNVPDDQTLSAHLQSTLGRAFPGVRIEVINHSHLGYFSSQEVVLFQWLLRSGKRADLAVFLDGLNDSVYSADKPDIEFNASASSRSEPMITVSRRFPPVRLVRVLSRRLGTGDVHAWPPQGAEIEAQALNAANRYTANMRLARASAAAFGVRALFVWQPTPYDAMDVHNGAVAARVFSFAPPDPVLKPLNALLRKRVRDPDFVFLGDLFANQRFADTYVDFCHYGDEATRRLAEAITEVVIRHNLLEGGSR